MSRNLVIVESPAKAGTIQKYLGEEYTVKPSFGHIRDLQDKKLSVDVEHGFKPEYVVPADKKKVVKELKDLAGKADLVWLASDEDREGEAISWHLYETLGLKPEKTRRIVFHEITKPAILHAIENPRDIDMNLVDAQQARRVLDRLVGFELSPVLWRKVRRGLSAGRVQSVALRLIVDREKEIMAFSREPFYRVGAAFHPEGTPEGTVVNATLDRKFRDRDEALAFLQDSADARFSVDSVEKKEGSRTPSAPFTTSTLQQEASRKLRFSVSQTMRIAQSLYERGLITYMRTDSVNLSSLAVSSAKEFINDNFGPEYAHPRQYRTSSKGAQEAHEAIRPTYISNTSIEGSAQEKSLYNLIWKRTVASQMQDARVLRTDVKIASDRREEKFSLQATEVVFDGFLKLYMESSDDQTADEEQILPEIRKGNMMTALGMDAECKFPAAPPRYSEATLVKKLEELGIGRPSTYAPTISVLTTERGYVMKGNKDGEKVQVTDLHLKDGRISEKRRTEVCGAEKGRLFPQEVGMIVSNYLTDKFSDIMDYNFTASVEADFDKIAEGELGWDAQVSSFYGPFHRKVTDVLEDGTYSKVEKELGVSPEGLKVTARFGQYGPYVQKGEGENRQYARLGQGQLIETLTLEEALKLFELPRTVGVIDGVEVKATKGRFGPYLRYGQKNISLPKNADPLSISLEECREAIEAEAKKSSRGPIAEWGDLQVLEGRYGPYIKCAGENYRIPAGKDAASLTEEECRQIVASGSPTGRKSRRK